MKKCKLLAVVLFVSTMSISTQSLAGPGVKKPPQTSETTAPTFADYLRSLLDRL